MTETAQPADAAEDLNPFHVAQRQFDRAMPYLTGLKAGLIDYLKTPAQTVSVSFPIETDGSVEMFTGHRLHAGSRAPCCSAKGM